MDQSALDFNGKTVWVTGAHQGIGYEIAAAFARLGAKVTGFDKKFSGALPHLPFKAVYLDLADEAGVASTVAAMLAAEARVDVLVNAAGVLHTGTVETLDTCAWQEMFDVNVRGVFLLLQRLTPIFKAQRQGAVVTIGSNAAHVPRTHMAGYGATKAALKWLCQSAALELAPYGVRCNMISPGSTDTPMQRALWSSPDDAEKVVAGTPSEYRLGIPLGKIARPTDIANLAVFLSSTLAGHIVMQDIVVDGGATLGA